MLFLKGKRVLVVDDSPVNVRMVVNLLTKLGKITNRLNNQNHQIDLSIVLGFY